MLDTHAMNLMQRLAQRSLIDAESTGCCCHSGLNYLQSVTPKLALGGEFFYLSQAMKSGVGFAARHQGDQHVATAQVATTGLISLNYAHKLSEKVGCSHQIP